MDRDEELAQELAASADVPPADSSRLTPAEAVSRRMRTWERAFLREQGTPATEEDMAASQTYKALVAKLRRIEEQAAQEAERQAALEAHRKEEEALEIFLSMPRYANQSRPRRYGIRTELSAAAAAAAERAADAAGSRSPRVIEAEAALEQAAAGSVLLGFLRPEGRRTLAAAMEAVTVPAGKTIYAVGQVGDCCYVLRSGTFVLDYKLTFATRRITPPGRGRSSFTHTACGTVVGEEALLFAMPRAASLSCEASGALWVLPRAAYRAAMARQAKGVVHPGVGGGGGGDGGEGEGGGGGGGGGASATLDSATLEFLRSRELLAELPRDALAAVAAAARVVRVREGGVVFAQGDAADELFFVRRGRVACWRQRGGGEEGGVDGGAEAAAAARRAAWAAAEAEVEAGAAADVALAEGACIGESALEHEPSRRVRAAAARAEGGDVELLALPAAALRGLGMGDAALSALAARSLHRHMLRAVTVLGESLGNLLSASELEALLDALQDRTFAPGAVLARVDQPLAALHLLLGGRVQPVPASESGSDASIGAYVTEAHSASYLAALAAAEEAGVIEDGGVVARPHTLGRGDAFGTAALLDEGGVHLEALVAVDTVRCLVLDLRCDPNAACRQALRPLRARIRARSERSAARQRRAVLALGALRMVAPLGRGAWARVQLAQHAPSGEAYALKTISKRELLRRGTLDVAVKERRLARLCAHPNVVELYTSYQDADSVHLLFEHLPGGELGALLRRDGPLDQPAARFYAACVLSALEAVHDAGVVHRDVRPENLLLDRKGYLKLLDFGFATEAAADERAATLCGCAEYLAPEVLSGEGHGAAADWWALGVLVYELLAGSPPYAERHTPMKLFAAILRGGLPDNWRQPDRRQPSAGLSPEAAALCRALLVRDPGARLAAARKGGQLRLKGHAFFDGLDWLALEMRGLQPPRLPELSSDLDTRYVEPAANEPTWRPEDADTSTSLSTTALDSGA